MDVFNTLIWTDAGHLPLVSHVLTSLEDQVRPIGFGGPPSTELQRVVDRLDLTRFDDLRQMIVQHEAAFLFLATSQSVSKQDIIDALQAGMTVLALEPTAGELNEIIDTQEHSSANNAAVVYLPAFRQGLGWRSAADPVDVVGEALAVNVTSFGHPASCSLFAQLHEVWHTVLTAAEVPDTITATLTNKENFIPTTLGNMHGCISAQGRLPDGRAVTIMVSDGTAAPLPFDQAEIESFDANAPGDELQADAGAQGNDVSSVELIHQREVSIVGTAGRVRADDVSFDLFDHTGRRCDYLTDRGESMGQQQSGSALDAADPANAMGDLAKPMSYAALVVDHWRQLLGRPELALDQINQSGAFDRKALACCNATLLSARTGQPESPANMLRLRK
jgi:hypothetical protein